MKRTLVCLTILFEMIENLNLNITQYLIGMAIQETATATDNWNNKTTEWLSINLMIDARVVEYEIDNLIDRGLLRASTLDGVRRLRVTTDWRKEYINARTY